MHYNNPFALNPFAFLIHCLKLIKTSRTTSSRYWSRSERIKTNSSGKTVVSLMYISILSVSILPLQVVSLLNKIPLRLVNNILYYKALLNLKKSLLFYVLPYYTYQHSLSLSGVIYVPVAVRIVLSCFSQRALYDL